MIHHDIEVKSDEGREEWLRMRLGVACSSEFHKIITPQKRDLSDQSPAYMHRLLAEWMTGEPVENAEDNNTEWMDRGNDLEDQAINAYEGLADVKTQRGGFITTDDGLIGCSPDRLIGDDGDLEIKCPLIHTQVGYALKAPVDKKYMIQLQGRMMIHGRQYIDIFSFHPRLIIPAIRVPRDEAFISDLRRALGVFVKIMLEKRIELEQRFGPFVRPEPEQPREYPEFLSQADADFIIANLRGEHGQQPAV